MKRVFLILLLLAGSFCFAETLKTDDYISLYLSEDSVGGAQTVRGIYPTVNGYYILEYGELKYVVEKGTVFYTRHDEEDESSILGHMYHYYKITIQDIKPNCITYTQERIK